MLGIHVHGGPEDPGSIDGAFPRALFEMLEFPELRRDELLEYRVHLAEEKAVFAVQKPKTEKVEIEEQQKGTAW